MSHIPSLQGDYLATIPWQSLSTPWGKAEHINAFAPGLAFISTARHGGYYVAQALNARIPQSFKSCQFYVERLCGAGWYEEDCLWTAVALTFPQWFPSTAIKVAAYLALNFGYAEQRFVDAVLAGGECMEANDPAIQAWAGEGGAL